MEEEKAAAYYDELTRKGEGAARFKQGLGFSSSPASNDDVPKPGSALASSSSSFLSKFVKASSTPSNSKPPSESEPEKKQQQQQLQLQSIQDKLKKKPTPDSSRVPPPDNTRERDRDGSSRSRDRYRERGKESRRRSRSGDRDRDSRRIRRRRSRSRSRSDSGGDRRHKARDRDRDRGRRRSRSRSVSPRRSEKNRSNVIVRDRGGDRGKAKNTGVDYAKLIPGYDTMSSAERVKAKMKVQLSETAAQDSEKGVGWERFEFDKDAPLDDEEIEVAEDDASLVKHIGQSFRFSKVEARREEQIQAAHEEAMFGASAIPPPTSTDSEPERENEKEVDKKDIVTSLLSETVSDFCVTIYMDKPLRPHHVLAKRKGSWRDRVRGT